MSYNTNSAGQNWTLEVVPSHAEQAHVFKGLVDEIFVTMIPGTDPAETIKAFKPLQDSGFNPVPHMAVRGFASEADLSSFCEGMGEHGIRKALVLAGGQGEPLGPYSESMQVIQSDAFRNSGVEIVALAGHPEGNPEDKNSLDNLIRKWSYLEENGLGTEIVTQWSFAPDKVSEYIQLLRDRGVSAPVRVGVAGPASLKTLLKYAKICGVTAAKEVLRKQGFSFGRLLMSNDPGRFVSKVTGTPHFHLYPFGGLEKCARWLREQAEAGVREAC